MGGTINLRAGTNILRVSPGARTRGAASVFWVPRNVLDHNLDTFNFCFPTCFGPTLNREVEVLTDISLSERARLVVHPWPLRAPTWTTSPSIACRAFPAVGCLLSSPFFLALSVRFSLVFRFVCVRVLEARHRGRARRRRRCQRVLAGRGRGVARSAVAVLVARRRVCLETRGKHEWALCLAPILCGIGDSMYN